MEITLGKTHRCLEVASGGEIPAGMEIVASDAFLNALARDKPTNYLRTLESVARALRDQRYVSVEPAVRIACCDMRRGMVWTHTLTLVREGGRMSVESLSTSPACLPDGEWLDARRITRSKKPR